MPMFDSDNVSVSGGYDRKKLRVGKYLVRLADLAEVVGGFKGNRQQTTFTVVKGRNAAPGTVKNDIIMEQSDPQKRKKDNYKIQKRIAAFAGIKPAAVTNEFYAKASRVVKVRSTQDEGQVIVKESFPAEQGSLFGKLATLVVKPHVNKKKQRTCYYEYEPAEPESEYEEFVDEPYEDEEETSEAAGPDTSSEDLDEARKRMQESEDAPEIDDAPEVEKTPLELAAEAGWRQHPKNKAYFFNAKDKAAKPLKEADLIAKFSDEIPF